ncbi:MAG: DUF3333 domain-containing protein, partial [Boseongicola sp.]|nr:DUF3333 domain-containing protein [Boseongicola sp.]
MTDASANSSPLPKSSIKRTDGNIRKRNAAEKRFKAYGIAAISVGLFFLVVLAVSIVRSGLPAFTNAVVSVDLTLTQEQFDEAEGQLFKTKAYQGYFNQALQSKLTEQGISVEFDEAAIERLLGKTGGTIREYFRENTGQIGT